MLKTKEKGVAAVKKLKVVLARKIHPAHNALHLVYFLLAAFEGHGWYAVAAGGLFGIGVAGWIVGEAEE